jgi:hypothetical protein
MVFDQLLGVGKTPHFYKSLSVFELKGTATNGNVWHGDGAYANLIYSGGRAKIAYIVVSFKSPSNTGSISAGTTDVAVKLDGQIIYTLRLPAADNWGYEVRDIIEGKFTVGDLYNSILRVTDVETGVTWVNNYLVDFCISVYYHLD